MSQRDGFTGGFLTGTIVGGIVGGIIGAVVASRLDNFNQINEKNWTLKKVSKWLVIA